MLTSNIGTVSHSRKHPRHLHVTLVTPPVSYADAVALETQPNQPNASTRQRINASTRSRENGFSFVDERIHALLAIVARHVGRDFSGLKIGLGNKVIGKRRQQEFSTRRISPVSYTHLTLPTNREV